MRWKSRALLDCWATWPGAIVQYLICLNNLNFLSHHLGVTTIGTFSESVNLDFDRRFGVTFRQHQHLQRRHQRPRRQRQQRRRQRHHRCVKTTEKRSNFQKNIPEFNWSQYCRNRRLAAAVPYPGHTLDNLETLGPPQPPPAPSCPPPPPFDKTVFSHNQLLRFRTFPA